jgi:hypothetical protein
MACRFASTSPKLSGVGRVASTGSWASAPAAAATCRRAPAASCGDPQPGHPDPSAACTPHPRRKRPTRPAALGKPHCPSPRAFNQILQLLAGPHLACPGHCRAGTLEAVVCKSAYMIPGAAVAGQALARRLLLCGRASAPTIRRLRGPNDGTGTSSGHGSALSIVLWWHTQQHTSSDRTLFARMLPVTCRHPGPWIVVDHTASMRSPGRDRSDGNPAAA